MELVTGAIGTLLPKLGELLKEEYNVQKSVKVEIKFLADELESMQTALLEVSDFPIDQPPSRQVKLWAKEVRELSYDLEDKIDRFMVRVDHAPNQFHGLRSFIDKTRNLLRKAKTRREICSGIKEIKTHIKEVRERRDNYKIDKVAAKPTGISVDSLRLLALYRKTTELVGTEERSNSIVKMLVEQEEASKEKLKLVSICGMGGLGKTTLANVVYKKLRGKFDCEAFVTVSLNPLMDKILKAILYQTDDPNNAKYANIHEKGWDEAQLINELRNHLRDKRYFILFFLRIFGTEEKCPKELAEVSKEILKKCGGVPLAIIAIASMLASKKEEGYTYDYWWQVCSSMGSGLENSSDVEVMRKILSVSYYDLPVQLRTCLLYLSLYPEDYRISTIDLICKWIGEGFIPKEQGKSTYEVGEDYIYELINRSLIQPVSIEDGNKASYCCLHDMVLDLTNYIANEDMFLTTIRGQRRKDLPKKIRRLAIHTDTESDVKQLQTMSFSYVRSFVVFNNYWSSSFIPDLSSFPVIRVLDLSRCRQVDNHHFKVICTRFHLRYLVLHSTSITEIPNEIGNLKFLQVLDISQTSIVDLPSSFVQLQKLVYLQFDKLISIPGRFGDLISLQDFVGQIHLKSPTILLFLVGLTEVRRVDLVTYEWDESYKKTFLRWLSSMVSLKYLIINGEAHIDLGSPCDKLSSGPAEVRVIKIDSTLLRVPTWMSSLSMLSILDMKLLTLRQKDLQVLGSILSLSELGIWVKEPWGGDKKLIIENAYPFPSLRKFKIINNTELTFEKGTMQNVQTLKFAVQDTMDQFGESSFGLQNLSSLEHVFIDMTLSRTKPQEELAAETAFKTAVNMIPIKPRLEILKDV
ncbi:hypothetical protein ACP4OV_027200 [Aristida adscensionis]